MQQMVELSYTHSVASKKSMRVLPQILIISEKLSFDMDFSIVWMHPMISVNPIQVQKQNNRKYMSLVWCKSMQTYSILNWQHFCLF